MRTYKPAAAAFAARRTAEDISNARRRGFISDLGQSKGSMNLYRFEEICVLRAGFFLGPFLKTYENGFKFVMERRAIIEDAARDVLLHPEDLSNDYVLTFTLDDRLSTGYSAVTSAPVAKITFDPDAPPPVGLLQVNFSEIARQVADDLRAYVRGQEPA